MTGRDIFKIWAPVDVKWTEWVRPLPFVAINEEVKINTFENFTHTTINYIDESHIDTAIIVDLPGEESVFEGIALSKIGYRPIPIYNGTNEQQGAMPTTNNHAIENALKWGALEIKKTEIKNDAPPAFLIDSNRMNRYKMNESVFDNSWDVYGQDMPSAEYFIKNGINKIIVRSEKIQKDLKKILYNFQKQKIKIFLTNGYEAPKEVIIKKTRKKDK